MCVAKITLAVPRVPWWQKRSTAQPWRGSIVFTSIQDLDPTHDAYEPYLDVTAADLRVAVNSFVQPYSILPVRKDIVRGVAINCVGDQQEGKVSRFSARPETPLSLMRHHGISPPLPELLGLRLLIKKEPKSDWKEATKHDNPSATLLNMEVDHKSTSIFSPTEWQNDVGSVVVTRADENPITPKQAEALCHYCEWLSEGLQPLRYSEGEITPESMQMRKDYLKSFLTATAFRRS